MANDFTPINTQEELDTVIASRLKRERDVVTKQFQTQLDEQTQKVTGYESKVAEMKNQIDALNGQVKEVEELRSRVREYEANSVKMRIAHETGLPYELADRLAGDDEAAIRTDAENLARLMKRGAPTAPLFKPSDDPNAGKDAALKNLLASIKNQGG